MPQGILNDLTRLVLVNAIYFNGTWANKFDRNLTKELPFLVTPERSVLAPMMTHTARAGYAESETMQVLSMPYLGGVASMFLLLPKKTDGLRQLEEDLSGENLKSWREQVRSRTVEIYLPKFKLTKQSVLNTVLQGMGMIDAFRSRGADFSGMANTDELYITAVIHKAFVDVDEKGTEAAAATAVAMGGRGRGPVEPPGPPPVFRADHPFLFLIQDNMTGTILFLGRLTDPTQGD